METNESILTRKVVGLDDRKTLGKVNELRVDCDTLAVSHYIVGSASTHAPLALPFASTLSAGDTFLTIQSRTAFVSNSTESQAIIRDGFTLLGVEVFSHTGNALGKLKSYEFDTVFGTVKSIALDDGRTFSHDSFVFFSPEFVFVNDGTKTAAELREQGNEGDAAVAEAEAVEPDDQAEDVMAEATRVEEEETQDAPVDARESDDDAALVEFLLGSTVTEDVTSKDGEFTVKKGTTLTQELVDEARAHDALLLLTMSVE